MKKYFTILVLLMISVSCTKPPDGPTIPTQIETVADLNGTWEFQNFYYPGDGNLTTCPCKYDGVLLSFNVTNDQCTVTDKCAGTSSVYTLSYLAGPKQINLYKSPFDQIVFFIESYNNGTLILRRMMGTPQYPIDTRLTLKKI